MRVAGAMILAAATFASGVHAQEKAMHHATGEFQVTITPEAQGDAPEGGVATSRLGITKHYSGGLVGEATGTMAAAGTPGPGRSAAYVAVEQFRGTVDGRQGGFVLVHRGTMTKAGGGELSVIVAPDSGTGALEGISGTLTIDMRDGKHFYDFAYTLPG